jgi:hypothetical protein
MASVAFVKFQGVDDFLAERTPRRPPARSTRLSRRCNRPPRGIGDIPQSDIDENSGKIILTKAFRRVAKTKGRARRARSSQPLALRFASA